MISKYGIPYVVLSLLLLLVGIWFLVFNGGWFWGLLVGLSFVLLVLFLVFFRDPERIIMPDDDLVLAPADGRVLVCERVENEKFVGDSYRVRIFMSLFDVHTIRMPVSGIIEDVKRYNGRYRLAFKDSAAKENARVAVLIKCARGIVKMHLIAGILARRIIFEGANGEKWKQGERIGIIKFGSAVEIFMPESVELNVFPGLRVKGGQTVIARWKR